MTKLGTVYPYKARLYKSGIEIGYCIDTPNAIANAIKETGADIVKPYLETPRPAQMYVDRISSWNTVASGYIHNS